MSAAMPVPVPTHVLPAWFRSLGISFRELPPLELGFGTGRDQYRLFPYPGPADDEIMAMFCEWRTADFFDVDTGPHLAIGLRGPTETEPHRGRGLAIGILANAVTLPENPDQPVPLFAGCPDPPGGPSMFVEDFSRNDGEAPIPEWQLSRGVGLPGLAGNGRYRIDLRVSRQRAHAAVWQVRRHSDTPYAFLGEVFSEEGAVREELPGDRGIGNAFIGTGFADPRTHSRVESIFLAHWKSRNHR